MDKYKRSIYVAQLPGMFINSNVLENYFEKYGKIESVQYLNKSAYFWFEDFSALKGLFEHGCHIVDGHVLKIALPTFSNEVFVSNIPFDKKDVDLLNEFREHGPVKFIVNNKNSYGDSNCAFVCFETVDGFNSVLKAYNTFGANIMKVNVAYQKLMFFEPPRDFEYYKRCKKIYTESLPQIISDKQLKSYFSKFDHIDNFLRKDYSCQLTFASTNGLKKVLEHPEHKVNGTIIYVRAFEHRRYVAYEERHGKKFTPNEIDDGMCFLVKNQQKAQLQKEQCSTDMNPTIPSQDEKLLTEKMESMKLKNEELATQMMPPPSEDCPTKKKGSTKPIGPPQSEEFSTKPENKEGTTAKDSIKSTMQSQTKENNIVMKPRKNSQIFKCSTIPGFKYTNEDSNQVNKFGSPANIANLKENLDCKEAAIIKYCNSTFGNSYLFH